MNEVVYSFGRDKIPVILDEETLDQTFTVRELLDRGRLNINKLGEKYLSADISIRLHKLITGFPLTDHINGNPLDNRKSNLRLATKEQNAKNRSVQSNNTSGFRGVHWDKRRNKWCSRVRVNEKSIYTGWYDNPEDAAKARDLKLLEITDDHTFIRLNFPELHDKGGCASCKAYETK